MAASKVTLQSAATLWVRTTASEVHSQQSLVRAARHDPRTERTRFGHTHVTRAALRCPCVPGGLCGNDEPAAHLAAAQLRVERSLFPRLTRATAWRARLAGARIARARAVGRSASRPQRTVAAQRAAQGLDPTAHRDRAEGCCGAPTSRWDGSAPSQSRAVRAPRAGALAAGLPAPRRTGDVKRGSIELRFRPRVAASDMSLPTLTRAPRARSGEAAAHTAPPCV